MNTEDQAGRQPARHFPMPECGGVALPDEDPAPKLPGVPGDALADAGRRAS